MKTTLRYCLLALAFAASVCGGRAQTYTRPVLGDRIPVAYTYSVDSLAFYIDAHFDEDKEKVEAIYSWITTNLKYNVYTTFRSRNEVYSEEKDLRNTLRTREGICMQFALLFRTLCEKVGIPSFVINGYNKSNGVLLPTPHDWCAAKIGAKWYLYDPTFGMGYVTDDYQFVPAPTLKYCQIAPEDFIRTHMPYDPIWQLLDHPYYYQEFDKGTDSSRRLSRPVCNFNDSIKVYASLPRMEQLMASYNRVKRNGTVNRLVDYYLQLTQSNISVYQQRKVYDVYKEAMKLQNRGGDLTNDFIRYRRQEFKPQKDEAVVRGMLTKALEAATVADSLLHTVSVIPEQYASAMHNLQASVTELTGKIKIQQEFADLYYSTPASRRKHLFH